MSLINDHDVSDLKERTRLRNTTVWITLDHGGIMTPIQAEADMHRELGSRFIEGFIDAQEEEYAVKEDQRDRRAELEQDQIDQEERIVNADATTKRDVLAIKLAAELYVHNAQAFDALVRGQIMAAKEYAARIEFEQIKLAELETSLDIAKIQNRLKEITAEIYYEFVKRQETEVEIARAKVDAAKAQVRAVMAEVDVKEAEVAIVEAELKEAMAEADKCSLQADVASLLAEAIVKGLAKIKYEVERDTIEAGFKYVQSKLDDMLAIWEARNRIEGLKTKTEEQIYQSMLEGVDATKDAIDLKTSEMAFNEDLETHKEVATATTLTNEQILTNLRLAASQRLANAKSDADIQISHKQAWAKKLVNDAQAYVNQNKRITRVDVSKEDLYIDKG